MRARNAHPAIAADHSLIVKPEHGSESTHRAMVQAQGGLRSQLNGAL